jgi:quinol-cytochrome oxidoreductase complex cytochrome b subunit
LVRQIHHWATIIFLAAIAVHMLRNFFTGAFHKPRELNWVIGVVLSTLVLVNGLFGDSLSDDLLSGTGLRIFEGVILSIPVVGTYLTMFLFGREFPGESLISRLFTIHIRLIPGILLALTPLHAVVLTWRQTHTQFPARAAPTARSAATRSSRSSSPRPPRSSSGFSRSPRCSRSSSRSTLSGCSGRTTRPLSAPDPSPTSTWA